MSIPVAPDRATLDEAIEIRRALHLRPEIGFEEVETTRFLNSHLASLGLEVAPCPTPTGAVAVLQGGRPGRTVMIRADIDALPIHEESGVEFASRIDGRMHACGHDAHTAILLGVARTLAARAEDLPGRYVLVFQPAEEIVSGAKAMIAGGLLDQHSLDAVIGLHIATFLPAGMVVSKPGLLWAGSDAYEVTFSGPGGHGGLMRRSGNVVSAQAFLIERLHQVVEGLEYEGAACHTTVGDVRTDGAWNIVPRSAVLKGSLRTFTPALRNEALIRLDGLLLEASSEFEVQASIRFVHGTVPLMNDPNVTRHVMQAGREIVGDHCSLLGAPLTVSDDMAEFLTRVPGCYFMVGAAPGDTDHPIAHHSPGFRIDEGCIEVGVRMLTASALAIASG